MRWLPSSRRSWRSGRAAAKHDLESISIVSSVVSVEAWSELAKHVSVLERES